MFFKTIPNKRRMRKATTMRDGKKSNRLSNSTFVALSVKYSAGNALHDLTHTGEN